MNKILEVEKKYHFIDYLSINSTSEGVYSHPLKEGILFHKSSFLCLWLDDFVKDVKTILDIGALDGGDAFRFSVSYPNATIYTIEASTHNYNIMCEKLSGEKNIKLFNCAISDKVGKIPFYQQKVNYKYNNDGSEQDMVMGGIFEYNDSFKSVHDFFYEHDTIEIDSFTLDEFCFNNNITSIDLAHVDVEGGGLELISGMNTILPKLVFIEKEATKWLKNKSTDNDELLKSMEEKNYILFRELVNDFLFVQKELVINLFFTSLKYKYSSNNLYK